MPNLNVKIGIVLLFAVLVAWPLAYAAPVNDIHFTNGVVANLGLGTMGVEITPNYNLVNVNIGFYNGSALDRCIVIVNATATIYNQTVNSSGTTRWCNLGSIQLNQSVKYGVFLSNATNVYHYAAGTGNVPGTNLNYTGGSHYSNAANTYIVYSTQNIAIRNITSDLASTGVNLSFTAKNFYTNTSITNFTIRINNSVSDLYFPTTNGTAVTNISTNASCSQFDDFTVLSNESGGYYNQVYTRQCRSNVSTGWVYNLTSYQSNISFSAVEKVTGNTITTSNFQTALLTNQTHYMNASTYNLTAFPVGYLPETVSFATAALNTQSYTFNMTNAQLIVIPRNSFTNTSITAFSATLSNATYGYSETASVSAAGTYTFNITGNTTYNLIVTSGGYVTNITNITLSSVNTTYYVYMFSATSIGLSFVDEETLLPVNNVNFTLVGSVYARSGNTSTTSNTTSVNGLDPDRYEIRYTQNGGNYTSRSFFFTIPIENASQANTTLYMLKANSSTSFVLTVTDTNNQPIPGLYASLLRRYAINNLTTYYVVEMMQPSVALQGATPFVAVANTVPYIFRITNSQGTVLFQGAGTTSTNLETQYLISQTVFIKVQTQSSVFQASQNFLGMSTSITNTSTNMIASWSYNSTYLQQICLQIYANLTTLVTTQCSTASSGIISYPYNPQNGTIYIGSLLATSTVDGQSYLQGNPFVDDRRTSTSPGWGYLGIFFLILALMAIGIGFADRPTIAIIMSGLTTFVFFSVSALGYIIDLPTGSAAIVAGSILVIAIIIATTIREDY
jgi:hypothetical protein